MEITNNMEPGIFVKDNNHDSYIEIDEVIDRVAYGKAYLKEMKNGHERWHCLDETTKIWFIDYHEWLSATRH